MHILTALGDTLCGMAESSVFGEQQERLLAYVKKLKGARLGMADVGQRVQLMQQKLNHIRSQRSPHTKALQQRGPFLYRCVWQGGVRYREYPHASAAGKSKIVVHGECVWADERVYISGEALVYLHVRGVGWLFESRDGVQAMRLVPVPPPLVEAPAAGRAAVEGEA